MLAGFDIFLPPIIAVLANVAFQILTHRYGILGYVKSIFLGFFVGLLVLAALHLFRLAGAGSIVDELAYCVGNLALYVCAGYLFFQFANIGESSIRFRIAREFQARSSALSFEELTEAYNDHGIIKTRLGRLINNSQVEQRDGAYRVLSGTVLLRSNQVFVVLKRLLIGKASEFH